MVVPVACEGVPRSQRRYAAGCESPRARLTLLSLSPNSGLHVCSRRAFARRSRSVGHLAVEVPAGSGALYTRPCELEHGSEVGGEARVSGAFRGTHRSTAEIGVALEQLVALVRILPEME